MSPRDAEEPSTQAAAGEGPRGDRGGGDDPALPRRPAHGALPGTPEEGPRGAATAAAAPRRGQLFQ